MPLNRSLPSTRNFYPRPPRGGRRSVSMRSWQTARISIHALREEGDFPFPLILPAAIHFYPRPPRGGRPFGFGDRCSITYFYPRPPRGGRPTPSSTVWMSWKFLSTPSARRATNTLVHRLDELEISIHALREEGDASERAGHPLMFNFYPRPPRGGRLVRNLSPPFDIPISIHALREEGDSNKTRP